jgi:hypothetical protein
MFDVEFEIFNFFLQFELASINRNLLIHDPELTPIFANLMQSP